MANVAAAKTKVEQGTNMTVTSTPYKTTGAITYTVDARDTTASAGYTAVSVTGGDHVRAYSIDLSDETKNSVADGKKHNTVVAGNNVSITEGTNAAEGVEYTVNAEKSTVSSDSLSVTLTPNADTLVQRGVNPSSMLAVGAGESQPVQECSTNLPRQQEIDCLQPNRRVTLDVTVTQD